jgi:phosphoglycerate-specific signal transduction histidine kinase
MSTRIRQIDAYSSRKTFPLRLESILESNDLLAHEDILHLTALREVFSGFAHEIAQPLNAIMIATQVIQLKLDRSFLTEEEKAFLKQRLGIVTSQAQRASHIVENLRLFSRANASGAVPIGIREAFETIRGLMGQQFIARGIDLTWECDQLPCSTRESMHLIEGVIVQALAFARDCALTIGNWHERKGMPYKKAVDVHLVANNSATRMTITWDRGQFQPSDETMDCSKHIGLSIASSVMTGLGGRLESSVSALTIDFP